MARCWNLSKKPERYQIFRRFLGRLAGAGKADDVSFSPAHLIKLPMQNYADIPPPPQAWTDAYCAMDPGLKVQNFEEMIEACSAPEQKLVVADLKHFFSPAAVQAQRNSGETGS